MASDWQELLAAYETYLRSQDRELSDGTIRTYCTRIAAFGRWLEGRGLEDPTTVTREDLKEYRAALYQEGSRGGAASPATVNLAMAALRSFFGWLHESGKIPANPGWGLRDIRTQETVDQQALRWLSRKEQRALLRAILGEETPGKVRSLRDLSDPVRLRDLALVGMMLYAGLRVSEVCALRRNDLPADILSRGAVVTVRSGKGGKARKVPLGRELRAILLRYLSVVSVEPGGMLFPALRGQGRGRGLTPRGVQYLVRRWGQRAGIPDLSPHDLRHTFCKNLVDAGVSLDRVAALAGHESIQTTRRYTQPSAEDLSRAVEAVALGDEDLVLVR